MTTSQTLEQRTDSVYITAELYKRAPKKIDYLREKLALQDLAARMAAAPEEILPRFVDLAMEMTDGISAGLSLLETQANSAGIFRWHYLRGLLAPFNGATTPRNYSPCGVTLDQNAPVLTSHSERAYDWIAETKMVLPEVLLVPLCIGSDEPLGTLWIVSDEEGHFDRGHARAVTELAAFVGIALHMLRGGRKLQQALDEQETLTREMAHRVSNLFAMMDGLLRISAKGASSTGELVDTLSGRLQALADAHALVRRDFSGLASGPRRSDLRALLETILMPHVGIGDTSRVSISGLPLVCADHAINGIALIFHELATNAAKYGALKSDTGRVDIDWEEDGDFLVLHWIENGGPEIDAPPVASGFGSKLAQNTIMHRFDRSLQCHWRRAGLRVTIKLATDRLAK
jgi:two-component sensor histidine kinase